MTHPRKALRDAVKAALVAGVPAVGGRVSGLRQRPWNEEQLPAIEVVTPSEQVRRLSDDGALQRDIRLEVVVTLRTVGAEVDDAADDIAEGVEAAVLQVVQADQFLHGVMGIDTELDAPVSGETRPAQMLIAFDLVAYADEDDPSTVS